MKKLLICSLGLLAISATAQTNDPVVVIKQFRAHEKSKIESCKPSSPQEIFGQVEGVYSDYLLVAACLTPWRNDDSAEYKRIVIEKPASKLWAIGDVVKIIAERIGTIQGVNDDGTPTTGVVYDLWREHDFTEENKARKLNEILAQRQIAAAQIAAQEAARNRVEESKYRALKYNQDAAAKGDAYGLLRMGERYRDGEGVAKDRAKALDYLTRAEQAGSPSAKAALEKLEAK